MGLSIAAIGLAVVLVVGLLAWTRRDLDARGASPRVWWLVVACYAFAASAWVVALVVPLPVVVAWLATVPAAVATVVPERVASLMGTEPPRRRRTRPISSARHLPRAPMARPIRVTSTMATRRPPGPSMPPLALATPEPERTARQGRHRWHPGDLRLAVLLLEDAARIADLDDAARARLEARLGRLDRFRDPATTELLALVRDDVHARFAAEAPAIDPDPERARRIAALLDELDPS